MRLYEFDQPRAAGCVLYAEDTGRWCLQQRSTSVSDPGVWSTWGGGVAPGETLKDAVRRELAEESGYTGPLRLEPLMMGQRYATYIGHVPHEFKPRLNFESQDSCWVEPGEWPSPLHPGLEQALTRLNENFADGRNPQDKGDSKRHGINTKASVSSLRKTAKQGGRKGQLAHWLANMKSGRAKAKRK